ncbi:MAG: hypothetical protein ABI042_08385 [Verrucomicrobiota bacterium]
MKPKILITLLFAAIVVGGLIFAYREMSKERDAEKHREAPVVAESKIAKNEKGETILTLDAEAQQRIQIKTAPLIATNATQEIRVYGRVLDPSNLVEMMTEVESTRVTAGTSRQELERVKNLAENVSAKSLQAGEAAARRDGLATQAAQMKFQLAWGKTISDRKDLAQFAGTLVSLEQLLIRLELPPGEKLSAVPTSALIASLSGKENLPAQFLELAPKVDEQTQGSAFIFLTDGKSNTLAPGALVTGSLQNGVPTQGYVIPASAIVYHEGKPWIFVRTDAKNFVRRAIDLKFATENGWLVSGLSPKNEIVVNGAQMLLSEEGKSQLRTGD